MGPPPGYGPGGPVVIDVGATMKKQSMVGSVVALVVGLVAVGAGAFGAVDGGAGVAIVAIAIGAVFVLIGLLPIMMRKKINRPRRLIFEPAGVRWDDPQGVPWAVGWRELAAVSISKHAPLQVKTPTLSERIADAAKDKMIGEHVMVRLDLYPADPGFRSRHPQMEPLWEMHDVKNGYRLPLGRNAQFIEPMAAGLARFAPTIYRGVQNTEGFMGLT
jgi:hypothetical protein